MDLHHRQSQLVTWAGSLRPVPCPSLQGSPTKWRWELDLEQQTPNGILHRGRHWDRRGCVRSGEQLRPLVQFPDSEKGFQRFIYTMYGMIDRQVSKCAGTSGVLRRGLQGFRLRRGNRWVGTWVTGKFLFPQRLPDSVRKTDPTVAKGSSTHRWRLS